MPIILTIMVEVVLRVWRAKQLCTLLLLMLLAVRFVTDALIRAKKSFIYL